ncbi:protein of unknown function [Methylococcus capsulatus]|uniref:Uncharacterized protein n=1 Tax=Methylococcus capsulatus TaxID=414 RepID=A0AA35V0V1_METCP|nr:protein of unknown function [Methylococcus capsulatus]
MEAVQGVLLWRDYVFAREETFPRPDRAQRRILRRTLDPRKTKRLKY